MDLDAPTKGQIETIVPQPLGLCVRSLAVLVKQRAHERDIARLERDLAIRERDTARAMLSVALGRLHIAERRKSVANDLGVSPGRHSVVNIRTSPE
jgi:hypothetical protein